MVTFYFADIDVTVELSSEKWGFINSLTEADERVLQQLVYMNLSSFLYLKAVTSVEDKESKDKNGG